MGLALSCFAALHGVLFRFSALLESVHVSRCRSESDRVAPRVASVPKTVSLRLSFLPHFIPASCRDLLALGAFHK